LGSPTIPADKPIVEFFSDEVVMQLPNNAIKYIIKNTDESGICGFFVQKPLIMVPTIMGIYHSETTMDRWYKPVPAKTKRLYFIYDIRNNAGPDSLRSF